MSPENLEAGAVQPACPLNLGHDSKQPQPLDHCAICTGQPAVHAIGLGWLHVSCFQPQKSRGGCHGRFRHALCRIHGIQCGRAAAQPVPRALPGSAAICRQTCVAVCRRDGCFAGQLQLAACCPDVFKSAIAGAAFTAHHGAPGCHCELLLPSLIP